MSAVTKSVIDKLIEELQSPSHVIDATSICFMGEDLGATTTTTTTEDTQQVRMQNHEYGICASTGKEDAADTDATDIDADDLSSTLQSLNLHMAQMDQSHPIHQRASRMSKLVLRSYSLTHLPLQHLAAAFPNISQFILYNCPQLNDLSLSPLLSLFPNIMMLHLHGCRGIQSLDFLSCNPPPAPPHGLGLQLTILDMKDCGLVYSPSWETSIRALTLALSQSQSRSRSTNSDSDRDLQITIRDCHELQMIPSSIGLLRNNLTYLHLGNLPKLTSLPAAIGDLHKLDLLVVRNTSIVNLPQEIGRLQDGCQVDLSGGTTTTMICPPRCFRGSVCAMRRYFAEKRLRVFRGLVRLVILFQKARMRAVDRLFEPGGKGYKRCRESFLQSSCKHARTTE